MSRRTVAGLVALVVVVGCGGAGTDATEAVDSTTTASTTTSTPLTTATTAPTTTLPSTLKTVKFAVPFEMPRPEGWRFNEIGDFYAEISGSGSRYVVFTTAGPPEVAGWIEKLTGDPSLVVTEPVEVQLGSASGFVLDADLSDDATELLGCPEPCAEFFAAAPAPDQNAGWLLYPGLRDRIWLIDVAGETVAVFAESATGQFDGWITEVEEALAGLVWTG